MKTEDRFWAKVDKEGGRDACWPWTAHRNKAGYGRFNVGRKTVLAHRYAWELERGPIPEGYGHHGTCALHRCDNPACVNPAHLFLGTQADNVADMEAKGRQARGERHGNTRLTEAQVEEIRALYAAGGVLQRELGKRFGVDRTTVSYIVHGKRWNMRKERRMLWLK